MSTSDGVGAAAVIVAGVIAGAEVDYYVRARWTSTRGDEVLQLEAELSHPRSRVWRALTDRQLLNAWFQPVGTDWQVSPNEDLPSFGPFELELVPAEQAARLLWRWHGKDFFSEAEWQLTATEGGCRLNLRQSGFLGSQQAARRKELLIAYQIMLDRLRAVLETVAEGGGALGSLTPKPQPEGERRPDDRRVRVLSVASAAVIVVMLASAVAVWMAGGRFDLGGGRGGGGPSLGSGAQPGAQPQTTLSGVSSSLATPAPAPSVSPSPTVASAQSGTPVPPARPATASYRVVQLAEGGFDAEVTVRGEAGGRWTVVLTMPAGNRVENRSAGVVSVQQQGRSVTVTPVSAGGGEVVFVIRYLGPNADRALSGCTVDGQPCQATGVSASNAGRGKGGGPPRP